MSNHVSEIVALTAVPVDQVAKAVLREIADTVREGGNWLCWKSNATLALRLGFKDSRPVSSSVERLVSQKLVHIVSHRLVNGGLVDERWIDIQAIMALPTTKEREALARRDKHHSKLPISAFRYPSTDRFTVIERGAHRV